MEQIAMAARLAEKETRLSEEEKKTFSGFLAKEFFTKKDFGKLESFYANAWDRLSEGGKEEMSKRIDEGIKRGEFKFDDLPEIVHEKEAQRRAAKARQERAAQPSTVRAKGDAGQPVRPADAPPVQEIDLSAVDLKGVKLMAAAAEPASTSIPHGSGERSVQRS